MEQWQRLGNSINTKKTLSCRGKPVEPGAHMLTNWVFLWLVTSREGKVRWIWCCAASALKLKNNRGFGRERRSGEVCRCALRASPDSAAQQGWESWNHKMWQPLHTLSQAWNDSQDMYVSLAVLSTWATLIMTRPNLCFSLRQTQVLLRKSSAPYALHSCEYKLHNGDDWV